jgi:transcriptional regulator NrdR family protein
MANTNAKTEANGRPASIECPRCGCRHFIAIGARITSNAIVRRRECRYCGRRMTTREQISA